LTHHVPVGDIRTVVDKTRGESDSSRDKRLKIKQHGEKGVQNNCKNAGNSRFCRVEASLSVALKIAEQGHERGNGGGIYSYTHNGLGEVGQDYELVYYFKQQRLGKHSDKACAEKIQKIYQRINSGIFELQDSTSL